MVEYTVRGCAYIDGLRGSMNMFKGVTPEGKVIVGRLCVDMSTGAYHSGCINNMWLQEQYFRINSAGFKHGGMFHVHDADNNHLWLSSNKGWQDLDDLL